MIDRSVAKTIVICLSAVSLAAGGAFLTLQSTLNRSCPAVEVIKIGLGGTQLTVPARLQPIVLPLAAVSSRNVYRPKLQYEYCQSPDAVAEATSVVFKISDQVRLTDRQDFESLKQIYQLSLYRMRDAAQIASPVRGNGSGLYYKTEREGFYSLSSIKPMLFANHISARCTNGQKFNACTVDGQLAIDIAVRLNFSPDEYAPEHWPTLFRAVENVINPMRADK